MPKRRRNKSSSPTPLEDILRRIRDINPTGRDLPAPVAQDRYRQKAALQSELIRRFGDGLEVVPQHDAPGVVSLRTKALRRDACHAVLDELDDEARAWVRRQLDEAVESPDAAAVPVLAPADIDEAPGDAEPADLLGAGLEAMRGYDLDAARAWLSRAFQKTPGDPRVVAAYLELLVDGLASDAEALALSERLSAAVRTDAQVRALLAVAAARTGAREAALAWLKKVDDPRACDAWSHLANADVDAGRLDGALVLIASLEALDPAHPAIREVKERVAEVRARQRGPREARVRELAETGEPQAAVQAARALLASDPDSAVARRVLQRAEQALREQSARDLLAQAVRAEQQGRLSEAVAFVCQASLTSLPDELAREAEGVRSRVEARRAGEQMEAAVRNVCDALDGPDRAAALLAYTSVDDEARARVRGRRTDMELPWLEAMDLRSNKRRQIAVAAALCLADASVLRERDPAAFLQAAAGHPRLTEVEEFRRWAAEANSRIQQQRERLAREALCGARDALASDDLETADALLNPIEPEPLPHELRASLHELRSAIKLARTRRRWASAFADCVEGNRWLDARDVALQAAETDAEPWSERARAAQDKVQETWCVQAITLADLRPRPEYGVFRSDEGEPPVLTRDGTCIVLHNAFGCWSFLHIVRLADGATLEQVVLKTPRCLRYADVLVTADEVWLSTEDALLVLTRPGWQVRRWVDFRDGFSDLRVEHVAIAPDFVHVWVGLWKEAAAETRVINLKSGATTRAFRAGGEPRCLWGAETPSLVHTPYAGRASCADCRGKPFGSSLSRIGYVYAAAVAPWGDGFVLAGEGWTQDDDVADFTVVAQRTRFSAPLYRVFDDINHEAGLSLATSRAAEMTYLRCTSDDGEHLLLGLRLTEQAIEEVFRVPLPEGTLLCSTVDATRASLVFLHQGRVRGVALGATPPVIPEVGAWRAPPLPTVSAFWSCPADAVDPSPAIRALAVQLDRIAPRTDAMDAYERDHGDDPDELLRLRDAMRFLHAFDAEKALLDRLIERHPSHPVVCCKAAERAAANHDFDAVVDWLAHVDAEQLPSAYQCHRLHLLGLAHLSRGDAQRARECLESVLRFPEPRCEVEAWLQSLVEVDLPLPEDWWQQDRAEIEKLLGAIAQADWHLERGETLAAFEMLDVTAVWDSHEVQSLARLALAAMELCDRGLLDPFRAAHAAAAFVERAGDDPSIVHHELLRTKGRWGAERLGELRERAESWLVSRHEAG